jgi:hypothetical protein
MGGNINFTYVEILDAFKKNLIIHNYVKNAGNVGK